MNDVYFFKMPKFVIFRSMLIMTYRLSDSSPILLRSGQSTLLTERNYSVTFVNPNKM